MLRKLFAYYLNLLFDSFNFCKNLTLGDIAHDLLITLLEPILQTRLCPHIDYVTFVDRLP